MFGLSRLVAYVTVFFMGFGLAIGLFVGIPVAMVANYSLRDLENTNLVNIPDEQFFDLETAKVDLLGLNGIGIYNELKTLQTFEEADLNINTLEDRYGIIFDKKVDRFLTDEARELPLRRLFSMEGVHAVLQNVYLGDIQQYECVIRVEDENGVIQTVLSDPKVEGAFWQTKGENPREIFGLEKVIADFNLDDFISGNINTDNILHGEESLTLADILSYKSDGNGGWIDADGNKVTGIMSVFADCTLDNVDNKINDAYIGELLSYTKVETGEYDEDGKAIYYWAEIDSVTGENKKVTGIMAVVAGRTIGTLGGLYDEITIGDLVPEKDRTGIFAILSPETGLNDISGEINKKIQNSPLQFYMNENLISFADQEALLDGICNDKGKMVTFTSEDEDFETNKGYYESYWEETESGKFVIEEWRTQPLNNSFSYILALVTEHLTSSIPRN